MSAYEKDKNPFCIPDLQPMYEAVRDYIKKNQGVKHFILTDDGECDTIWTLVYTFDLSEVDECEVKAVRVKNDRIEIVFDYPYIHYDEESIIQAEEEDWFDIQYSDIIGYIYTIFNLADFISEYV